VKRVVPLPEPPGWRHSVWTDRAILSLSLRETGRVCCVWKICRVSWPSRSSDTSTQRRLSCAREGLRRKTCNPVAPSAWPRGSSRGPHWRTTCLHRLTSDLRGQHLSASALASWFDRASDACCHHCHRHSCCCCRRRRRCQNCSSCNIVCCWRATEPVWRRWAPRLSLR